MQKKLIALAVAGLVSGAAFAQVAPNNVVLSGIVDMGYQWSGDSLTDQPSQHAFNDGGHDQTRIKLDGTEDLGNGLKVGFHLEQRFNVDTRSTPTVDNQNLFLSGSFGTVTAGSFGSALDDINGYSEAGGMGWGNGVVGMFVSPGHMSNAVKYNSPNFNGLDFMASVSTQNVDDSEDLDGNVRAYTGRVSYVNGPIKAGVAYYRQSVQNGDAALKDWLISGSYNFGPVILGAGYAKGVYSGDDYADGAVEKQTAYRVNIGAPIGANDAVALSYSRVKHTYFGAGNDSEKASGWGLSYTHNLSKRTNLYASYGQVNQDEDNENWTVTNSDYQKAFKVGLRHQF